MRNYQYRPTFLLSSRAAAALLALNCIALTACAHGSKNSADTVAPRELKDMTSSSDYKLSSLAEYPELTPGEVSRKFLKFLISLDSVDDLSVAAVSQGLGLPLKRTISDGYAFRIVLPESGWSYGVDYLELARMTKKTLSLDFANKTAGQDPTPVCEVGLNDFVSELKRAGYSGGPEYGEIGQLENYSFRKGKVDVLIREWGVPLSRDGAATRACVESVSVHSAE
jgi:hypothetical protein